MFLFMLDFMLLFLFFFLLLRLPPISTLFPYTTLFRSFRCHAGAPPDQGLRAPGSSTRPLQDRKSTRLNSSHSSISYAVFCLKKKNQNRSMLANIRIQIHHMVRSVYTGHNDLLLSHCE